jgi:MFS family permease
MSAMRTNRGSPGALQPSGPDRPGRRMLRAAWWSFGALPLSFVGASLLGGAILAAIGHDPDSESDPSIWQMAVAGIPSVVVLVLPCVLVVWFGRRALAAGHEGGRDASTAGLVVGAALVMMNLISVVVRLLAAVV